MSIQFFPCSIALRISTGIACFAGKNLIADCRKTIEEKAELLAQLLKTAYDENLKLVILYQGDHHMYLNLDDDHPNTIGKKSGEVAPSRRNAYYSPLLTGL